VQLPDWLNDFLQSIHDGDLQPGQIDPDYYDHVADTLVSAAAEGLGGSTFGAADYRNTLKAFLDQNIYAFSGAKSLYMLEQYRNFLTDETGKVLSTSAFISKVADLGTIDDINHLKAEGDSAIACAQAAQSWQGLLAFAAVEYRTSGERVCPICAPLNGLVFSINDPRLRTIYVPNHFFCHCLFLPAAGDAQLSPDDEVTNKVKAASSKMQPYFKRNVGQQKLIYSDKHPYIKSVGVDKLAELDAEKNYGMRSGEKIYANDDLPKFKPLADKDAANAWWQQMAGSQRGNFDLKAVDNISVTFDNEFRNHVLEDNRDDRFRFLNQLKQLVQSPDEVWANRQKGVVNTIYIKYFENAPIALVVEADKTVRALTMYEVKKGGEINYKALKNIRKGALKYKTVKANP